MLALSFETRGFADIFKQFRGIRRRLKNPMPGYDAIADNLERHTIKVFRTEGRHIGKWWRRLALSTRRARARRWGYYRRPPSGAVGPSGPVLRWAGVLANSFRRGGFGHIRMANNAGLRWGSRLDYAAAQNVTRPIVGFRDARQERQVTVDPMRRWIMGFPQTRL